MPAGDGTGPWGMGPMTGRGMGWCNPAAGRMAPGFGRCRGLGRGFGPGRGFRQGFGMGGRGWRHRFYATGAPGWAAGPGWGGANPPFVQPWAGPWSTEDELAYLKDYAANLQAALEDIRAQVADLESQQQGQPSSEKQG